MKTIMTAAAVLLVSFSASAFISGESFSVTTQDGNISGRLSTTQLPEFKVNFNGVTKNLGDMNDRLLSGFFNLTIKEK